MSIRIANLTRIALGSLACFLAACIIQSPEDRNPTPEPQVLRQHPRDSRYLEYQGKPIILITSAEHYGAVLNLDFDYDRYLETLAADGLNYTRLFTGSYVERASSFGIEKNSLAPARGRLIVPWARSDQPGYINGGNRFDLNRWDPQYFQRLKDFVTKAADRGIIVEVTLFSSTYQNGYWEYSPLHPHNNINLQGPVERLKLHTLDDGPLLAIQEKLVRKFVRELNGFNNVFFEIQNEPYADRPETAAPINPYLPDWKKEWRNRVDLADQASLGWQRKIASFIVDEESRLPVKHLIAQNFCNFGYPIANLDENIRILNFHYAFPEAVALNYGYERVMSFDESGFSGSDDAAYRRQAWKFILAGGGIFNSLDYSFYPGAEGGSGENRAPGGGSPALRKQLGILKRFIEDFDYLSMGPDPRAVRLSPACRWQALANRYREFAIYVEGESSCPVTLNLYPGDWHAEWLDTRTGEVVKTQDVNSNGVSTRLETPAFEGDIALRVRRR